MTIRNQIKDRPITAAQSLARRVLRSWVGLILCSTPVLAEPEITLQPTSQSVSLLANVTLQVRAAGVEPVTYQWQQNGQPIAGAISNRLDLTGVQLKDAGTYTAVISDSTGSVTSREAALEVDPTFAKITTGDLVSLKRDLSAPAWGDYDNDGDIDLFLAAFSGQDLLFQNNGDGTFTSKAASETGPLIGPGQINLGLWADFDNDGHLDLFRMSASASEKLFRNLGNGSFGIATNSAFSKDIDSSFAIAWGDLDQDGFVDLALTVGDILGTSFTPSQILARNERGTSFARLTDPQFGSIVTDRGGGTACAWADIDNDGDLDLFVGNNRTGANKAFLYRNNGSSGFTRVSEGPIANDPCFPLSADWGDFDNDGDFDLIVGNGNGLRNSLYRNLGDGQFERVSTGNIAEDANSTSSCAWADYDNDGNLDLIVGNTGKDFLYHGNGDGTFKRVLSGSPSNDSGSSSGVAWGDYDNDGFMDLFVANGGTAQLNYLYRNSGNTNRWLKLKLTGTSSNRSAIGAKVRVKAIIRGREVWQLRQVSGGHEVGQNDLRPNFGLGDAAVAEIVRIEWPSGLVQEIRNVPANQILDVIEPVRLASAVGRREGQVTLKVEAWPGFAFDVERSADLKSWTPVSTATSANGLLTFNQPAEGSSAQFFRVSVRHGSTTSNSPTR